MEAAVVGGGQAGLATSHELSLAGVDHVVLDLGDSVASRASRRCSSLVARDVAARATTPRSPRGSPGQ